MKIVRSYGRALTLALAVGAVAACAKSSMAPTVQRSAAALLDVIPGGGSVNVDVGTTVTLTFNHPMDEDMAQYAALMEGTVTGPVMPGAWSLSDDGMKLVFTPDTALKPATTYVIHVGGGMMDAEGDTVDLGTYGPGCGGEWATGSMMGGQGMMGGGAGWQMGSGWAGDNGTYGMLFTFTTAG
ncbi:MAG: Ig-like domain-containing protein [Gemmatimonadetes bacterium]|nr:Ig-like domain-containing protein [Gemmatimonadota bacterium]